MDDMKEEILNGIGGYSTHDGIDLQEMCKGEIVESIAKRLFDAGYRLDPYPNGKSKGELIARVEELEGQLAKARMLLDNDHRQLSRIKDSHPNLVAMPFLVSECPVCTFLVETSTVKS